MNDEMNDLLEIIDKLKEVRCREYTAAIMAGDYTKSEQLEYAVEAFGMVEWIIKDLKYAEYIRRIYEIDKREPTKDDDEANASIETETNEKNEEAIIEEQLKVARYKAANLLDAYVRVWHELMTLSVLPRERKEQNEIYPCSK